MNSVDQEMYCVNIQNLDWDEYFFRHTRGLRMYLLKDPMDTIPAGQKKYRK